MKSFRILLALFILLSTAIFLIKPTTTHASGNSFVTIVNPQRISKYTKDYVGSFQTEAREVEQRGLPATWPVTYDVLEKKDFVAALKNLNSNQELGIFLEVTPKFAQEAGVTYTKSDSWHRANSLFLSGYTQHDRQKLIDKVFEKFKEEFGYYPVSVGAWWVDSYSLSYMQEKYHITGVLGMSDQYDLDGYQLWGTWWSVPYYPSKINAALPASNLKNKLNIVTFRWAARDPLNGYSNTDNERGQPSLFSIQDYPTIGLPQSYLAKLVDVFAVQDPHNAFGQLTIGLEGDQGSKSYIEDLAPRLNIIESYVRSGQVQVVTMKDFSAWYMNAFPNLSPNHLVTSNDLLGRTTLQAFWYQTLFYRIGLTYDPKTQITSVVDLRTYPNNLQEPYYKALNKQFSLSVNLPYVIDTVIDPTSRINMRLGKVTTIEKNKIHFEKGDIEFLDDQIKFPSSVSHLPHLPTSPFPIPPEGIIYKDYSLTVPFTLKRRFPFLPGSIPFITPNNYYISQTEFDALKVLKNLPKGTVLAYDKDCLKCTFETPYKPAAAAGKKSYVEKLSSQPTQVDISFLLSKTSQEAKKILKDKGIRYIYLAKYEDYIESLPYLPQDLRVRRIYENANAEIWEVK